MKKTNNKAKTAIKIHDMWKNPSQQENNFEIIHIQWLSDSGERNGRKLTVLRRGSREMEKVRNKNSKSKTTASFVEAVWKWNARGRSKELSAILIQAGNRMKENYCWPGSSVSFSWEKCTELASEARTTRQRRCRTRLQWNRQPPPLHTYD